MSLVPAQPQANAPCHECHSTTIPMRVGALVRILGPQPCRRCKPHTIATTPISPHHHARTALHNRETFSVIARFSWGALVRMLGPSTHAEARGTGRCDGRDGPKMQTSHNDTPHNPLIVTNLCKRMCRAHETPRQRQERTHHDATQHAKSYM